MRIDETRREWSDEYPDTLTVEVETDKDTGEAFTVVSGAAVWLKEDQVFQVIEHLARCVSYCREFNGEDD